MAITAKASASVRLSGHSPIPIGLQDVLKFEKTAKRQIAIVREKGFKFPTNHLNRVYQVASALHRLVPDNSGVRISIQKNIPPQKGLGSWASASAEAVRVLNRLWDLRLSERELLEMGEKIDPSVANVLKFHSKGAPKFRWAIVAVPKRVEIDRDWALETSQGSKNSVETVVESHFPDLVTIKRALGEAGWKLAGLSGWGPAIGGFSEKRVGIAKIPKNIRSKLSFVWIGKCL